MDIFIFVGPEISVKMTHFCDIGLKQSQMLDLWTGGYGCVPIKLYLKLQVVGHICLEGYMAGPLFQTVSNKPNKEIRYMIARRSYVFSMERENIEQGKEDWKC